MLSRPSSTTAFDRLAKVTLIATAASLLVGGGLTVAHMTQDTCSVDASGLDPHARLLVARRTLACHDYEHGRITKDQYQSSVAEIDLAFSRPASQRMERVMWAASVLGYSTQYSDTAWSAQQALGAPNVYPNHGDIQQAWASRTADEQDEWIELGYEVPRTVSAVEIYETYNPGAIDNVELITTSGRRIQLRAPTLPDHDEVTEVHKSVLQTPCTTEPIAAVRINIGSVGTKGWNEIDAVGLVPCTAPGRARIESP
ncbi:MAG: hypothetical protein M4D80_11470 [Myxococcota bacterium]|nr:hypothetical protein [Myxococcota bacterium]